MSVITSFWPSHKCRPTFRPSGFVETLENCKFESTCENSKEKFASRWKYFTIEWFSQIWNTQTILCIGKQESENTTEVFCEMRCLEYASVWNTCELWTTSVMCFVVLEYAKLYRTAWNTQKNRTKCVIPEADCQHKKKLWVFHQFYRSNCVQTRFFSYHKICRVYPFSEFEHFHTFTHPVAWISCTVTFADLWWWGDNETLSQPIHFCLNLDFSGSISFIKWYRVTPCSGSFWRPDFQVITITFPTITYRILKIPYIYPQFSQFTTHSWNTKSRSPIFS